MAPKYQVLVWGGRRMQAFRDDLPDGPVGESWDLADHERGMSVIAEGPLAGATLREVVARYGPDLVGDGFSGGPFPLLVKLIDAADRLSVQVHPDDALARTLGLGDNGKTECWLMVGDGGELFQGTRPGVTRQAFEGALAEGRVAETLNRFDCRAGDFFFLEARTVHALGAGCLLYEVQQTSDITFRVWDWGRVGFDGKPRPMHVKESLETIDFSRSGFGPLRPQARAHPDGGQVRMLADCAYFKVEERIIEPGSRARHEPERAPVCAVLSCLAGGGTVFTDEGAAKISAMRTVLIPAVAGGFRVEADAGGMRLLHATPKL